MKHSPSRGAILNVASLAVAGLALSIAVLSNIEQPDKLSTLLGIAGVLAAAALALLALAASKRASAYKSRKQIFIAYAKEDEAAAIDLAYTLKAAGLNPWLSTEQLLPGEKWQETILDAVRNSIAIVLLVSKHSARKGFVATELQTAFNSLSRAKGIDPIIPLILDEHSSVPERLKDIQWVTNNNVGIEKLIHSLRTIASEYK